MKTFNSCDKKLIEKFILECSANGLKKKSIIRHLSRIKHIRGIIKKDFVNWGIDDVKRCVAELSSGNYHGWTIYGYKISLRKFFSFIGKKSIIKWIRLDVGRIKVKYEILGRDEIESMISIARTLRDKAFISTLYGSGCRIGELVDLKTDDISWDEHGCVLNIKESKTEPRPIRLIEFSQYLELYLKHRKYKSDYVWIAEDNYWKGKKMSVKALRKLLFRVKRLVGVQKRVYLHGFRHSRATELSRYLTDQEMKIFFGWSRNSRMPNVYSHLSGRDVDEKMISMFYPKKEIIEDKKIHTLKEFI